MHQKSLIRHHALRWAALASLGVASAAYADFTYDLRFSDGSKSKVVTQPGTYTLDLWVQVTSADGTFSDDALSFGALSVLSNQVNGGVLASGGIVRGTTAPAFTVGGQSFNGMAAALNDDGIQDWGTNTPGSPQSMYPDGIMYWLSSERTPAGNRGNIAGRTVPQESQQVSENVWEWRVAQFKVGASSLQTPAAGARTQFLPRFMASTFSRPYGVFLDDPGISEGSAALAETPHSVGTPAEFIFEPLPGNDSQIVVYPADHSNPSTGGSSRTLALAPTLVNGVGVPSSIVLAKAGDAPTGYSLTAEGGVLVDTDLGGFGSGEQSQAVSVGFEPTWKYGSVSGIVMVHNSASDSSSPGRGSADADDTLHVSLVVGLATPSVTREAGRREITGGALTAQVAAGGSYANLASKTENSWFAVGSEAVLGAGVSSGNHIVSMSWRTRGPNERDHADGAPAISLVSDVVAVSGLNAAGGASAVERVQTDPYLLKLSYDPALLRGGAVSEIAAVAARQLRPVFLQADGTGGYGTAATWLMATDGNFGGAPVFAGVAPFGDSGQPGLSDDLGRWGIDPATHTVWAVVNHASQFAVASNLRGPRLTWSAGSAGPQDGSGVWAAGTATWWNDAAKAQAASTDLADVVFGAGGAGAHAVAVDASGVLAHTVSFAPNAPTYTVAGGTVRVTAGMSASSDAVFDAPVAIGAPQDWSVASGRTLAINGPIQGSYLNKVGPGTLLLNASNGHAGTRIEGGTVQVASAEALGQAAVLAGGILRLGAPSLSVSATLEATSTIDTNGYDGSFSGSGSGTLTKAGAGTLDIRNMNVPLRVTGGAVRIQSDADIAEGLGVSLAGGALSFPNTGAFNHAIHLESAGTLVVASYIQITTPMTGEGTLIKEGPGDLTIYATGSWGGTTVRAGNVAAIGPNLNLGHVTIENGGRLNISRDTIAGDVNVEGGGQFYIGMGPLHVHSISIAPGGVMNVSESNVIYDSPATSGIVNNGTIAGPTTGAPKDIPVAVSGAGSMTGGIQLSSVYSPGNSPAAVSVDRLYLVDSSTLKIEVGGTIAGSQYDQIEASGLLSLDGKLEVSLISGFVPQAGDAFYLFKGTLAGDFDELALPALPAGLAFDTRQLASQGLLTVVPEPASALLGLPIFLLLRRRSKQR